MGSSGTGGYSDLKAASHQLQVDAPRWRMAGCFAPIWSMDAGSFPQRWELPPSWAPARSPGTSSKNQTDSGASVAVGWKRMTPWERGSAPPTGFIMSSMWVWGWLQQRRRAGGVHRFTSTGGLRFQHRCSSTFGGQKDSSSRRRTWGGVRADGGGLSLKYDRGRLTASGPLGADFDR